MTVIILCKQLTEFNLVYACIFSKQITLLNGAYMFHFTRNTTRYQWLLAIILGDYRKFNNINDLHTPLYKLIETSAISTIFEKYHIHMP